MSDEEITRKIFPEMYETANPIEQLDYYSHGKGMEGLEPHDLRQPQYWKGQVTGVDTVKTQEIPNFLRQQFESAAKQGKLPEVFRHYVAELKRDVKEGKYGDVFDEKMLRALENHIPEINKAITYQDQKEAMKVIADYLGRIRIVKRQG